MSEKRIDPVEVDRVQTGSTPLDLGARPQPRAEGGWTMTLPVRSEDVSVGRRTVAVERIRLRTRYAEQPVEFRNVLRRREVLVIEREGNAPVDEPRTGQPG